MRILFLTHRLPYAPNRGDRTRAYSLLKAMSQFATVSLFSLVHDDEEAGQVPNVPFAHDVTAVRVTRVRNFMLGAARLASHRPLTHSLLDAPDADTALAGLVRSSQPDLVVAFCSSMARFALTPGLIDRPCVLDMVDVDSVKWALLGAEVRGPLGWVYRREARTLRAFEEKAVRHARATLVVSEREREALLEIAPGARVIVLPVEIDVAAFTPPGPPAEAPLVIFCGVMNYLPNEMGVRWFAENVWPKVRAARPDARLIIVGSSPTKSIRQLAATDPSIEVTGRVPTVQPYLWKSAISVAPLAFARGLQTKVLEALAAGLPVVVTPAVMSGLPPAVRSGCIPAEGPDAFAQGVVGLLSTTAEGRRQRAVTANLNPVTAPEIARSLKAILTESSVSASH